MIIYATKETFDRYKLNLPSEMRSPMKEISLAVIEKEKGDRFLEWGCKLFYFDRKKCLQIVNFASKLTIFLIDVKVAVLPYVGNAIADYLFEIYKDKPKMEKLLKNFFAAAPLCCFDKLQDKSIIATLNRTQLQWAEDGYFFYDYVKDGILNTKQINKDINNNWYFGRTVDGKKDTFRSADEFERLLIERFK